MFGGYGDIVCDTHNIINPVEVLGWYTKKKKINIFD